jgi:hypothetical protein
MCSAYWSLFEKMDGVCYAAIWIVSLIPFFSWVSMVCFVLISLQTSTCKSAHCKRACTVIQILCRLYKSKHSRDEGIIAFPLLSRLSAHLKRLSRWVYWRRNVIFIIFLSEYNLHNLYFLVVRSWIFPVTLPPLHAGSFDLGSGSVLLCWASFVTFVRNTSRASTPPRRSPGRVHWQASFMTSYTT